MKKHSGFTLVEIAIVLVIIGLLLGGVLKGQELINSAKVKNFANDFRNIPLYIYGYQDKFRTLPGDDPDPSSHVGGTKASTSGQTQGNGVIEGTWYSTTATDESFLFWQHVRLAGLTAGPTDTSNAAVYVPKNADSGIIGIQSNTTTSYVSGLKGTYLICSSGILGKFAKQLDQTLDDGCTSTGSMMSVPNLATGTANAPLGYATSGGTCTAATVIDDNTPYTVCMGI